MLTIDNLHNLQPLQRKLGRADRRRHSYLTFGLF